MLTFTSKSWSKRRHRSQPSEPGTEGTDSAYHDTSVLPEDAARGWHDSSMELRRGLDVTEDVSVDTLPNDPAPAPKRR